MYVKEKKIISDFLWKEFRIKICHVLGKIFIALLFAEFYKSS